MNRAAPKGMPALAAFASILFFVWLQRDRTLNQAIWIGLAAIALYAYTTDVEDFRHLWVMIGLVDADRSTDPYGGPVKTERDCNATAPLPGSDHWADAPNP
jgi:hypothetical protein